MPHIVGKTDVDVAFGAGYATAQDRQLIMELLRGPGRIAALDAPGIDAFSLALAGKTFVPSAATESRLNEQYDLLLRSGDKGRRLARVIDAYVAGINAAYKKAGLPITPWTRADVVAIGGLIGGLFGAGGGDETQRADFLARLQASSASRSVVRSGRICASATIPRRRPRSRGGSRTARRPRSSATS